MSLDKLQAIDAKGAFAWRHYCAEATRNFEKIKQDGMKQYGVDIECCRETYIEAGERLFAVIGDLLMDAYSKPHRIEPWEDAKARGNAPASSR
jgi:hypothetical protein